MSTAEVMLIGIGVIGVAVFVFVTLLDRYSTRHAHHRKP